MEASPHHPLDQRDLRAGRACAAADQLGSTLAALAPALAQYRQALAQAGFPPEEALALTTDAQASLLPR